MTHHRNTDSPASLSDSKRRSMRRLPSPTELWSMLREHLGAVGRRRQEAITDPASLRRFLETRASFVAQTSLYGYLRTRAGSRYPELFQDDKFVTSINIAKWQVWLACLSDISVYAGSMLVRDAPGSAPRVGQLMQEIVAGILAETGIPHDAGPEFAPSAKAVLDRLAACEWTAVSDDAAAFTESPPSLVHWAPIVDKLKQVDEPIVLNSVRFRWQEVRRDLRQFLDVEALRRI